VAVENSTAVGKVVEDRGGEHTRRRCGRCWFGWGLAWGRGYGCACFERLEELECFDQIAKKSLRVLA
jgi:hypothetical protein